MLYTLVKAQEAQFLTACWFVECLQLVMKLECHGTRRHYMVAKHFNLKSLVADLFVSLAWNNVLIVLHSHKNVFRALNPLRLFKYMS